MTELMVRAEDLPRLRRVCRAYLYTTRWAGWLGQPLPKQHKAADRKSREAVTAIRHERRVCASIIGRTFE